ncbi:MAG: UbiA family prenyltransferase [Candidatus Kapabacteria bacterium]|nr:UbiA family prenyltransferase [Candidatus Kapabacteria bacterium]
MNRNLTFFIVLISVSLISIIYFSILASREVKFILIPLSIVTLFYSFPFLKYNSNLIFKLREIPYLKIFIISLIWSIVTVVIPVIRAETHIEASKIMLIMIERFLFIFAITIPFDIRDIETDKKAGMRTIPILLNEKKSITISNLVIGVFLIITTIHFIEYKILSLFIALVISGLSTLYILNSTKIKQLKYYHFGILDGTMILQFILIYLFYTYF